MIVTVSVLPVASAIGPDWPKAASSSQIGTIEAMIVPPTMVIGRSRSVSGSPSPWPARRARLAASADMMPLMIGPMILIRVQMAATPIVPAPMKRTF